MAALSTPRRVAQPAGPARGAPWLRQAAWLRALVLAAILALALALRLARLDVVEFKSDEIEPLALADEIWLDHRLPLTRGVSSTGLPETPLVGYLLVLPRALSADPRLGVGTIALLDGLGVVLTYCWLRRFAGERIALLAASLYAANPWAVIFARKTWAEILPVLTVLALWAACEVVLRRRRVWALAFFPLLALQVQAHVMGALYLPAALLTLLAFWPRWKSRYTLFGLGLGLLILLPYGIVLGRQWVATRAVLQQGTEAGPIFDLKVLTYALWFASGATLTALMGRSVDILRGWEQALRAVNLLTAGVTAFALGLAGWAALRRRRLGELQALLLIWLAGPLVPLVLVRGALGIHYLLLLVPALFVLAAAGWARVLGSRLRAVALASGALLAAVLAVQAGAVLAVYDGVARYAADGGFDRPLGYWQTVQHGVQARAAAEGWGQLYILGIDDAPWSGRRAALDYLLGRQLRLRYVGQGGRPGVLVPERDCGALLVGGDRQLCEVVARLGDQVQQWPWPGDGWGIRLYRLRGQDQAAATAGMTVVQPTTFDNGMRLLGARLPAQAHPGEALPVTTYWAYTGRASGRADTDMAFNHLLDAGDRRWAQYDGFALSRSQWQSGETLIQWFEIALPADLPPGDYWLYSGMYSWRDSQRAMVVDEGGQPIADGVRLGPITVTE